MDPRIKLSYYISQEWEQEFVDDSMKILHDTYNENYLDSTTTTTFTTNNNVEDDFFAFSFGLSNNSQKGNEIDEYLSKPVEHYKTDPLLWWKVTKCNNKISDLYILAYNNNDFL